MLPPSEKDSLLRVWNNPQEADSSRMNAIRRYAWHGYLFSQPDSAFYFSTLFYDFAKEKKDSLQMSIALNVQATALNFQGDYINALEYYNRSLEINELRNDTRGIGAILNNMGNIIRNQGNYPKATEYFFRSLKVREKEKDSMGIATSLLSIGSLYSDQNNYKEALDYLFQSYSFFEKLGEKEPAAGTLNNIGLVYSMQGNYEKAIEIYNQSLKIREEIGNQRSIAEVLTNLGSIYRELGQYDKAFQHFEESLSIFEEIKDQRRIALSLYNIGKTYAEQKHFVKATEYGNRALNLIKEVGDVKITKDITQLLYESNKSLQHPALALEMYELHIKMKDSINNQENKQELMRQQFQYDFEKREADILAEQIEKEANANEALMQKQYERNITIIIFSVLFLFIMGGSWLLYHQRKSKYRYNLAQSELKTLRAQMKPHFIFNVLNSIHHFIEKNNTQVAKEYLVKFSKLMRNVLNSNLKEEVLLQDEIDSLKEYLELEKINLNKKFNYSIVVDEVIDAENTIMLPLIVQPFLENAIWHGIAPKKEGGNISLNFSKEKDKLRITINDDGIGRSKAAKLKNEINHKSVGIQITKERIKRLNQKKKSTFGIVFEDLEQGLKVTIDLPFVVKF